jgi:hypothetical protein
MFAKATSLWLGFPPGFAQLLPVTEELIKIHKQHGGATTRIPPSRVFRTLELHKVINNWMAAIGNRN